MTTIATRLREFGDLEGFDIQLLDEAGDSMDTNLNGVLGKYDFDRKAKSTMTVADFKENRLAKASRGKNFRVLYGDGREAQGNTLLRTVRESYDEE